MRPLVIRSANPRTTYITPKVATKAGTLKRAMSTPLTSPTTPPRAQTRTATTQTGGNSVTPNIGSDTPCIRKPATTPHNPSVDPTERSMPPLRITSSIPTARMPKMATCDAMVRKLPSAK